METQKCYACFGSKKLMGMGMIQKDCYVCDGVGHIKAVEPAPTYEPAHGYTPPATAGIAPSLRIDKRSKAYRDAQAARTKSITQ